MEASRRRPGLIRSALQPEETAGLTRSSDLSRMLPAEAHLLAAGWPRAASDGGAPMPFFMQQDEGASECRPGWTA